MDQHRKPADLSDCRPAKIDKNNVIIFLTEYDARAHQLVERLAKMPKTPAACRQAVSTVTDKLTRQAKLRNKYSLHLFVR
jgi:hypothetical protein